MDQKKIVSIIISTQNRADDLRETLISIGQCAVPADMSAELLVVDNASTDHTSRVLKEARIENMTLRPLFEPRRGKSKAFNMALRRSVGDVILTTDDDMRAPRDWLEGMCRPILNGDADGVIGGVKLAAHLEQPWLKGMKRSWMAITDDYDDAATVMIGANMSIGRHVLEKVPGLDEELGPGAFCSGDDVLFSWQFHEAGFRVKSALGVVVEHHLDASRLNRPAFLKRAVLEGRQEAYLFHHWLHGTARFPRAKMWARRMKLAGLRAIRRPQNDKNDIAPDWELRLLMSIGFCEQYLVEKHRARNYSRRGLRRMNADESVHIAATPAALETA